MLTKNNLPLQKRLAAAFADLTGARSNDPETLDFCFHMTDWQEDFHALYNALQNAEEVSDEKLAGVLQAFLVHATGHIDAAARLAGTEPIQFELPTKVHQKI